MGETEITDTPPNPETEVRYSRREAMKAVTKYAATIGAATAVVVTADGVVSAASAYNCPLNSNSPHCN